MTKKDIYNLTDLIDALNAVSSSDKNFLSVLDRVKFSFKDIEHLCFWDADSYSKINIGSGVNYTLDLICWEKEQQSPIHSHEIKQAWVYVFKGEVSEKLYSRINNHGEFILEGNKVLTQNKPFELNHNKDLYHQLTNVFSGRSVSLHLYIK